MESPVDIAVATTLVVGAAGYVAWRLRRPAPPSCAPAPKATPTVVLGTRLARGLAAARDERKARGDG